MTTEKSRSAEFSPFLWTAALWLAIGLGWLAKFPPPAGAQPAIAWLVALWMLCLLDLVALARAVVAIFEFLTAPPENRFSLLIRASYWAFLKITCLGIFALVLFRGRTIPGAALVLGIGTLVAVPLIGSAWWGRRLIQLDSNSA